MVAFSTSAERDGETVLVRVGDDSFELDTETARRLQSAIGDALTDRTAYFRTAGEHRPDGSYVVSRRAADSTGNRKVFDSFDALRRLYERLPDRIDAEAVSRTGITGSRRHMLVRHFAEHPAFDCELAARSPLAVEKREEIERDGRRDGPREDDGAVEAPAD